MTTSDTDYRPTETLTRLNLFSRQSYLDNSYSDMSTWVGQRGSALVYCLLRRDSWEGILENTSILLIKTQESHPVDPPLMAGWRPRLVAFRLQRPAEAPLPRAPIGGRCPRLPTQEEVPWMVRSLRYGVRSMVQGENLVSDGDGRRGSHLTFFS
ncbi:hypothetical protein P170DRAFT_289019 [Aspergillus steynii IBT 23096]|uniref:Uncharacterized protein n=1 Tax=Aspergillus steynii IBT 23096 TaxID=1392250 RepID=A0A2I2FVD1_9EURO|nr:uncharacterized protein P170DRAFT_289019 [Aspergillus steynii IBT 23096]PLB44600.1 hypothetical protein P170DRAFT_289019 [Aspergillus steynii IBT 23096]